MKATSRKIDAAIARSTLSAQTKRMPVAAEATRPSRSASSIGGVGGTARVRRAEPRKVTALTRSAAPGPIATKRRPPTSGPTAT